MNLQKYNHVKYDHLHLMNKLKFPKTIFTWEDYKEFNEIYHYCQENMIIGKHTKSGGIAGGCYNRGHSFYYVLENKVAIELVVCDTVDGCYRFLVNQPKGSDNPIDGTQAQQRLYNLAETFGVLDVIKKEVVTSEEGEEIKKNIESPYISIASEMYKGREFDHCYHADANASYFSRICEWKPELRPLGDWLMKHRKENDGLYKHVMTNTIGAWQSRWCVDIEDEEKRHRVPFQLAKFSQIAINGTNRFIENLAFDLFVSGYEILLYNTDGIWYRDTKGLGAYHNDKEGPNLCQWKNDHNDCKLYIKSAGAYQYLEDGKVKSVVRGQTALDQIKPDRDTWEWREIENYPVWKYKFDIEKGIIRNEC